MNEIGWWNWCSKLIPMVKHCLHCSYRISGYLFFHHPKTKQNEWNITKSVPQSIHPCSVNKLELPKNKSESKFSLFCLAAWMAANRTGKLRSILFSYSGNTFSFGPSLFTSVICPNWTMHFPCICLLFSQRSPCNIGLCYATTGYNHEEYCQANVYETFPGVWDVFMVQGYGHRSRAATLCL